MDPEVSSVLQSVTQAVSLVDLLSRLGDGKIQEMSISREMPGETGPSKLMIYVRLQPMLENVEVSIRIA